MRKGGMLRLGVRVSCAAFAICLAAAAPLASAVMAAPMLTADGEAISQAGSDAAAPPGMNVPAPIVLAQNDGWHPLSPLMRLFRGGRPAPPPRQLHPLRERSRPKRVIRKAAPVIPKIVEQPKADDARTVLVVGDAMAKGLARGLKDAYAQTPTIAVRSLTVKRAGLIRANHPNWPTRIEQAIKSGPADVVVIWLGSDDRRRVTLDGSRAAFRSPEWQDVYRAIVQRTVAAVRDARKPLIWVGLPPASGPDRRADFSYLNDFYKEKVETADGIFVDLWEIFLSEEGKYTSYGADVDGKRQRLRTNDGLYFTWSGYRKAAFFVEQRIARLLGEGPALELAFPGNDADVILLSGGAAHEETLAGAEIAPAIPADGSLQHRLIVEGRALPRVEGRADDYGYAAAGGD